MFAEEERLRTSSPRVTAILAGVVDLVPGPIPPFPSPTLLDDTLTFFPRGSSFLWAVLGSTPVRPLPVSFLPGRPRVSFLSPAKKPPPLHPSALDIVSPPPFSFAVRSPLPKFVISK